MAIQSTPPIQLDPSMDRGHELAFINQNFNNIANVLSQNSFVIVQSGTASVSLAAINSLQSTTVTHNLGYIPIFIAFQTTGTQYFLMPYTAFNTTGGTLNTAIYALADTSSITFLVQNSSVSPGGVGPTTIKYYLLQQTAN